MLYDLEHEEEFAKLNEEQRLEVESRILELTHPICVDPSPSVHRIISDGYANSQLWCAHPRDSSTAP